MADINKIQETLAFLNSHNIESIPIGIILGTGLGALAEKIAVETELSYSDIPNFPVSTVETHSGKLLIGMMGSQKVIALQGRFHYYEGYSFDQITFPVRVLNKLGVKLLIISNAAGSMNPDFKKGNLMLIEDHINLQAGNPLIGPNNDDLGPRFPDMSEPYSKKYNAILKGNAVNENIILHEGVYVSVPGPMLETRAEYRFLRRIGADAVGMSTVPEVIVARHMGMDCVAVSVLTDECDPDNLKPVDIADIIAIAGKAEKKLSNLFEKFIESIDI